MTFGKYSPDSWTPKYNFSSCYCKIVGCWYVDSLVCRLHNYAKKLIFKEFVLWELPLDGISAFDHLWKFCFSKNFRVFFFSTFAVLITILGPKTYLLFMSDQ